MLVLSRKKGEAIYVGHNIKIVIVDLQKDYVRVGIEAPDDIDIYRSEIYQAIQNENLNAIAKQDVLKIVKDNLMRDDNK
ncbi:MAG: hypothetical protein A4E53_00057 [Pelotomaculum sp. PtaB.Bin104]|nr:MAG: hypothetical protein A4E53_00057 [Pelotomaculum sp. PtaB.Bin104]